MAPAGTPWFLWRITVSSLMCAKLEAWPYRSTFWSMQIDLLQGKTGNSVFLSAPSFLSLNLCWIGTVSPQEPIKKFLCLLLSCRSHGCKPHWLSDLDVSVAWWKLYKMRCYILGPMPLLLREKLRIVSSLMILWLCAGDVV